MGKVSLITKIIKAAPSVAKGIKNAIAKVGKQNFEANAKNIPIVVRHNRLRKGFAAGKKQRAKTAAYTKAGAKDTSLVTRPKVRKSEKNPRIPDRRTTLGKAGYNYQYLNSGGLVNSRAIAKKHFKGTF